VARKRPEGADAGAGGATATGATAAGATGAGEGVPSTDERSGASPQAASVATAAIVQSLFMPRC
jgi:hypothetical protein